MNGEKISSKRQLEKVVLSAQVGSKLNIQIQRVGEKEQITTEVFKKPNYKLSALAFLENLGLNFNKNLKITSVEEDSFAKKSGLKQGDKLLQINFKNIKTLNEVRNTILYNKQKKFNLLFTRDGFQFFIKFSKKDIKGGLVELSHCPKI